MVLIMIKQFQQRHACVLCKIEKKKVNKSQKEVQS